ncbi:MAG: L,D-transpeptidase family protein [Candidatus Spyradenecus sp.]
MKQNWTGFRVVAFGAMVLAFGARVWAEGEAVVMPPQEEVPFRVVIEEVPDERGEDIRPGEAAEAEAAREAVETPVAERGEPAEGEAEAEPEEEIPVAVNCAHALKPPKGYDTEVLMLQIFLDRHNFSCGVIDGVWGRGSLEAMRAWQQSQGLRRTQWVNPVLYGTLAEMPEPLVRYVITAEDVALVSGPMPPTWAERSRLKVMGYETLGACVAERFHTSERTLRRLNPAIINWPEDLAEGTVLVVPNVREAALEAPASLAIALEECVLAGFDGSGRMNLRFPCSIARAKAHLPKEGVLKVVNMAPAPNYTYDPRNYGQDPSVGKMIVPPGPRNPVGSRWIGLSLAGYGIHGTPKPNTVGRAESRGCFRLTNWNAEKLFELVQPGTPVTVVKRLRDFDPPKVAEPEPETEADAEPEAEAPTESAESAAAPAASEEVPHA